MVSYPLENAKTNWQNLNKTPQKDEFAEQFFFINLSIPVLFASGI